MVAVWINTGLILLWVMFGGMIIHGLLKDIRDELRKQNEKE